MKAKPCPFCGVVPETHPKDPKRDGNAWGAVRCENVACATFDEIRGYGVQVKDGELVADDRGIAEYIKAAVRRWNNRPVT